MELDQPPDPRLVWHSRKMNVASGQPLLRWLQLGQHFEVTDANAAIEYHQKDAVEVGS